MHQQSAKELLEQKGCNFVSIKEDTVYTSDGNGIMPIMKKLLEDPLFFEDASIADIIIGKAAAMLLVYGKAKSVYTRVISEQAMETFMKYQIPFEFDTTVPHILNREKTGTCPMEQTVMNIDDPAEAFQALNEKITSMRNASK